MDRLSLKNQNKSLRKNRVRAVVTGTSERPRLSVFISNTHVSAQIIDDIKHTTMVSATTIGDKKATGTMTEKSTLVGTDIAKKAVAKKIKKVSFDRNGRKYHGRVKALADAARQNGLEF
jgi:large subunit ribosomal protein L18